MKKLVIAVLVFIITLSSVACSSKTNSPKLLNKEGVAPYELSESEEYILRSFGMENNSHIISFNAPKEAITLDITVYRLENDGKWKDTFKGGVSIGEKREPIEKLVGTFAIQLKENNVIDFNINAGGLASYKTEPIILDTKTMLNSTVFLKEFQKIEINKEIPVAMMVSDSGESMESYSFQDYFEPTRFEGMDLVQVITLNFRDK